MKYSYALMRVCLLLVTATLCHAQRPQPSPSSTEPRTKLEAFQAKTGAVIIKGYTEVGTMAGLGGSIKIESMEFTDAQTGTKQQGIVIEAKESGRLERESRAFVDYDEIDSLVKGLDYIGKIDASVTKLAKFEASYKTKGDLSITTFNETSGYQFGVTVGSIGGIDVFFKASDLERLKALILEAKMHLAEARVTDTTH